MGRRLVGGSVLCLLASVGPVLAQEPATTLPASPTSTRAEPAEEQAGLRLPDSEKLRIAIRGLAGYGFEPANENEGRGHWGRVGFLLLELRGALSPRFSYFASINPVNEVAPLASCGEPTIFSPNDPAFLYKELYARGVGPDVACDPDGRRRVDMYRGIALDVVDQQGALREFWLNARLGRGVDATFGRMLLPIGFNWQQAGSLTAKDAPMIQRINAELNFGGLVRLQRVRSGRRVLEAHVGAVIGEGNAWKDYAYQFFQDGTMDGNRDVTAVASVAVSPVRGADVMVSFKGGYTGSKIERFHDSYFGGGKHNDRAVVLSGQYRFSRYNRVLGEYARYTWGLASSSATMVGSDPAPVVKTGFYVTLEGGIPVRPGVVVGGSFTREAIDRADAMVRYLAENGLYDVVEGKTDRMQVIRVFVDLSERVRVAYFTNAIENPFPWVSGIYTVEGPTAFTGRSLDRWGLVVSFTVQ